MSDSQSPANGSGAPAASGFSFGDGSKSVFSASSFSFGASTFASASAPAPAPAQDKKKSVGGGLPPDDSFAATSVKPASSLFGAAAPAATPKDKTPAVPAAQDKKPTPATGFSFGAPQQTASSNPFSFSSPASAAAQDKKTNKGGGLPPDDSFAATSVKPASSLVGDGAPVATPKDKKPETPATQDKKPSPAFSFSFGASQTTGSSSPFSFSSSAPKDKTPETPASADAAAAPESQTKDSGDKWKCPCCEAENTGATCSECFIEKPTKPTPSAADKQGKPEQKTSPPASDFSFGAPPSDDKEKKTTTSFGGFSFGSSQSTSSSSPFSFGSPAPSSAPAQDKKTNKGGGLPPDDSFAATSVKPASSLVGTASAATPNDKTPEKPAPTQDKKPTPASGFSFGAPTSDNKDMTTTSFGGFSFGAPKTTSSSSPFSFGSPASAPVSVSAQDKKTNKCGGLPPDDSFAATSVKPASSLVGAASAPGAPTATSNDKTPEKPTTQDKKPTPASGFSFGASQPTGSSSPFSFGSPASASAQDKKTNKGGGGLPPDDSFAATNVKPASSLGGGASAATPKDKTSEKPATQDKKTNKGGGLPPDDSFAATNVKPASSLVGATATPVKPASSLFGGAPVPQLFGDVPPLFGVAPVPPLFGAAPPLIGGSTSASVNHPGHGRRSRRGSLTASPSSPLGSPSVPKRAAGTGAPAAAAAAAVPKQQQAPAPVQMGRSPGVVWDKNTNVSFDTNPACAAVKKWTEALDEEVRAVAEQVSRVKQWDALVCASAVKVAHVKQQCSMLAEGQKHLLEVLDEIESQQKVLEGTLAELQDTVPHDVDPPSTPKQRQQLLDQAVALNKQIAEMTSAVEGMQREISEASRMTNRNVVALMLQNRSALRMTAAMLQDLQSDVDMLPQ